MPGDSIRQHRENRNVLLLALSEGPQTSVSAAARTGVSPNTAKRILAKFVDEGVATAWWTPGRNGLTYGLSAHRPTGAFDSIEDAIRAALRRGPGTAAELGQRIGVDPTSVRTAGKRMAEAGTIATWWAGKNTAVVYGLHEQKPAGAVTNSREAVIAAVSREPMDVGEIVQATGLGRSTVQRWTDELRRTGAITRRAGRFTLPGNGRARYPGEEAPREREVDRLLRLYDSQATALRKTQTELEERGVYVELAGRAVLREDARIES